MDIVVFLLAGRVEAAGRKTTIPGRPRCYGSWRGHSASGAPAHPPVPAALLGVRKHTQTVMEGEEEAAAKGGVLGRLQGPLCHS